MNFYVPVELFWAREEWKAVIVWHGETGAVIWGKYDW